MRRDMVGCETSPSAADWIVVSPFKKCRINKTRCSALISFIASSTIRATSAHESVSRSLFAANSDSRRRRALSLRIRSTALRVAT